MAFLACDKDGTEWVFGRIPIRDNEGWDSALFGDDSYVELPSGSIKKLIGKELTWNDDPVELIIDKESARKEREKQELNVGDRVRIYDRIGPMFSGKIAIIISKVTLKSDNVLEVYVEGEKDVVRDKDGNPNGIRSTFSFFESHFNFEKVNSWNDTEK